MLQQSKGNFNYVSLMNYICSLMKMQEFIKREQSTGMTNISNTKLIPGQLVLLHNTRLRLFTRKLKARWFGPFKLLRIYPHRAVDLLDEKTGQEFKVNGHWVKHYIHSATDCSKEVLLLKEPSACALKWGQAEGPKIKRSMGGNPFRRQSFQIRRILLGFVKCFSFYFILFYFIFTSLI